MGRKMTKEEIDRDIDIQIMKLERGSIAPKPKKKAYVYTVEDLEQSKKMSVLEVLISTAVGFIVAIITQWYAFPLFEIIVSAETNYLIACIFTIVSIIRGYCVRRFFNWLHGRF